MKVMFLSEVDGENSFFHFSNKAHMIDNEKGPGIPKVGISNEPRQRPNAYSGDENYPCTYFSKGFGGVLELFDIWIRGNYDSHAKRNGLCSGRFSVDDKLMEQEYDEVIDMLKNAVYLKLDLISGNDPYTSDYCDSKEDFRKREILDHDSLTDADKDLMWYYGVNSDFTTARMDRWNMSTHLVNFKHDIPPERITLLLSSDGHDDALSILVEIYTKYRNSTGKIDDLDKFMDYLFNKSKDKLYLFEKK